MTLGEPIVAGDVADQGRVRPLDPVRDLDEFLAFLAWIETAFGRTERPRRLTTGDALPALTAVSAVLAELGGAPVRSGRRWPREATPGHRAHPQLLDHRAHRPRQVDARRPPARAHRDGVEARDVVAVPRRHGPRARARHHHQGALRAARLPGARRAGLRPEPDRHARARRLHLRGVAQPGGLRGRHPGGRRLAGRAGADHGQRLPRARARPRDHPGAEQDRPAERRARPRAARDRGGDRSRRLRRHPRERQGGDRHRRDPGGDRPAHPAADGRCRRRRRGRSSSTRGSTPTTARSCSSG